VSTAANAATSAAGAGAGAGGSGASDISGMSDGDVLDRALVTDDAGGAAGGEGAAADESARAAAVETANATAGKADEAAAATEEVNLAALEEGQPEWLGKITDEAARGEVTKLLDLQKAFGARFKDAADLEGFFKDLPGGREQVTALQTLSKEVTDLDAAIGAGTPEQLAGVAERYLGMAQDGGVGLLRAAATHLATKNPEGWNQIGGELVDSTLRAGGIGLSFNELKQTIGEIKDAVANQDADAYGRATAKLLGAPKAAAQADPRISKAQQAEKDARTAERGAKVEVWESRVQKNGDAIETHTRTVIGKALAAKDSQGKPLIPDSIPQKSREELVGKIIEEIDTQVGADKWLGSQIYNLVGSRAQDKHNLAASDKEFGKALDLSKGAVDKVVSAAVKKVISGWARDLAAGNKEARERAKGGAAATRKDLGGAGSAAGRGSRVLTMDDVVGPKAKSDSDLLDMTIPN
jgi:hypothetical protein